MPIKVLLVEDHEIVRQGLKALLSSDPDIAVIDEAANGAEAVYKLKTLQPDLVVMDMNMPVMNGLECTKLVKNLYPKLKVLVLSMHDHENYLSDMIEAGAWGYMLKNSSKEELVFAIKKIAGGGIYVAPEFTLNLLARHKSSNTLQAENINIDLTEREIDVLKLIADGHTNTQISNKLFTSVRTIETRRKKLLEKTGTSNTATLIRFSVQHGLIK